MHPFFLFLFLWGPNCAYTISVERTPTMVKIFKLLLINGLENRYINLSFHMMLLDRIADLG